MSSPSAAHGWLFLRHLGLSSETPPIPHSAVLLAFLIVPLALSVMSVSGLFSLLPPTLSVRPRRAGALCGLFTVSLEPRLGLGAKLTPVTPLLRVVHPVTWHAVPDR